MSDARRLADKLWSEIIAQGIVEDPTAALAEFKAVAAAVEASSAGAADDSLP